jgi:hypothetical protein
MNIDKLLFVIEIKGTRISGFGGGGGGGGGQHISLNASDNKYFRTELITPIALLEETERI